MQAIVYHFLSNEPITADDALIEGLGWPKGLKPNIAAEPRPPPEDPGNLVWTFGASDGPMSRLSQRPTRRPVWQACWPCNRRQKEWE